MRTFVVGDIHGHVDPLRRLLGEIRPRARQGDSLVFIGDYIDRGPDSKGVIDLVIEQQSGAWDGPVVTLKGNHEAYMMDVCSTRPTYTVESWLKSMGGDETVMSYTQGELNIKKFMNVFPRSHLDWFVALKSWHEDENGIYVHAGLRPGERPEEADEETLLWIREEFLTSDYAWDKVVVFGHTPQYDQPVGLVMDLERLPWRPLIRNEKIGVDTGIAYGGFLTAVILPDREFVSVRGR